MESKRSEQREIWRRRIAEQEDGGGSVRAFCKEKGLPEHAFYGWRQRLSSGGAVTFALVESKQAAKDAPMLELLLAEGDRLRIPAEESWLRLLLRVLRERS
jgi:hypothetical protein